MTAAAFVAILLKGGVQLWTEGDRLRFRAAPGALTPDLHAELAGRKADVLALLRPGALYAPASFEQERHWFFEHLAPGSTAYTLHAAWRLHGQIDAAALADALAAVVARHGALRTTLAELDGTVVQVVQVVRGFDGFTLPIVEVAGEAALGAAAAEHALRAFDLAAGPLFRAVLLRHAPDDHVLVVNAHHAVCDGAALEILWRELAEGYAARADSRAVATGPAPFQYVDHACRQREREARGEVDAGVAYWTAQLAGAPAALGLPTDRPGAAAPSGASGRVMAAIPPSTAAALETICLQAGATPFMGYLAAFQLLLARHAQQHDVVVGTPTANRHDADEEGAIGCFTNMIALRTDVSRAAGFVGLVGRVRDAALDGFAHEHVPFHRVVEALGGDRGLGRHPVFQAVLSFAATPAAAQRLGSAWSVPMEAAPLPPKFDLTLLLRPAGESGAMGMVWVYSADLFDGATVEALAARYTRLLESAVAAPADDPLGLEMATGNDLQRLDAWSWPPAEPWDGRCVHELVVERASRTPAAMALSGAEGLTYAELVTRAERLAARLRSRGIGLEDRVGICLDRSAGIAVAALAVLRVGGAYVPIDPEHPAERVEWILRDSGVRAVVAEASWHPLLSRAGIELVTLDGDAAAVAGAAAAASEASPSPGPRNAAYVIYTSGSTGVPKGVVVEHAALANLVAWHRRAVGLTDRDRTTLLAGLGFDASVWELWPPLVTGAALYVVPEALRSQPERLRDWMVREGVTVSFAPTPLAEALLALDWPEHAALRLLLTGGDTLRSRPRADLPFALVNNYGPTENAVVATSGVVGACAGGTPSIGRPLGGVRAYVLDEALRRVPPTALGELCLGGAQVARGYLRRPGLTAERFVPDPLGSEPGARMYRTGDRARWRRDGTLEFRGRLDRQVKIHGYRIEPGEVEVALLACPGVTQAVVVVVARRAEAGQRLVAYVAGTVVGATVREWLRLRLPGFMVPSTVIVLDAIPVTANGKLDRAALPDPGEPSGAGTLPRTVDEEVLCALWAGVLRRETVGVHDDFFALGGHSLLATRLLARVREAFGVELPLVALWEAPTVAGLAARLAPLRGAGAAAPPILPVARPAEGLPASFAQQRLWFLDRLGTGEGAYHISRVLRLSGMLDVDALRRALDEVACRHEALRTVFVERNGDPMQVVLPPVPGDLVVDDLSEADQPEEMLRVRLRDAQRRPFDLASGPVFRGALYRLAAADHVLLLGIHHVAADGWGVQVLLRELGTLYGAFAHGEQSPLPAIGVQYADFAVWQRDRLSGDALQAEVDWWTARLRGAPELLKLPTDRPRRAVREAPAARERFSISPALRTRLTALAQREGATLFMVLLAGFHALLARWSGEDDVVAGTPIAGRTREELEGLIGCFANLLVLRGDLSGDPSFRQLLARVREATLGAYSHQELPFERLVEALGVKRTLSHAPLVQSALLLHHDGEVGAVLPGLETVPMPEDTGAAKFDLLVALSERQGGLDGTVEYAADLWDSATPRRMMGHFVRLLDGAAEDPDGSVSAIDLMTGGERHLIEREWSGTVRDFPSATVHALFEAQVRATPDALALEWGEQALTYAELNARANRLARCLRARGAGLETRVGVSTGRGPELVVALLATLKSGGAYVPLDLAYPAERITYMASDAGVSLLLVRDEVPAALRGFAGAVVSLERDAAEIAVEDPADLADAGGAGHALAYVIYTSGSTGQPKGIAISHRGIVRLVRNTDFVQVAAHDRMAQISNASFDALTWELWGALLNGATLVGIDQDTVLSPVALVAALRARRVTAAFLTAALFNQVARVVPDGLSRLTHLCVGGEACDPAAIRAVLQAGAPVRLLNAYGPTESTTFATWQLVRHVPDDAVTVPIGQPIANTTAYVLDTALRLCPIGMLGELFLGGAGLARGYVRRPALTAERFVPDPFGACGERLYRTGDRVRRREDGAIEFLGRMDRQLKVRGFRIEPGEVEAALLAQPDVHHAIVVARAAGDGETRLVAYVVTAPSDAPLIPLRERLREILPAYTVPAAVVVLEAVPLTPNGKVDHAALPDPGLTARDGACELPRSPEEAAVAAAWADVLRLECVGVHEDFFALGGHSLLATRVASRLGESFGVSVPLRVLFERPTVAGMGAWLAAAPRAPLPAPPATLEAAAAAELLGRIDELSASELDSLLATLSADRDTV